MCLCTHSPCPFWAPGFPWLTTAKSLFQALSPAWQRIRCSSTESKQPPFRGSKYFATCCFSLIYYEHFFPFLSGDLPTLRSHKTSLLLHEGRPCLYSPPAIPGTSRGVSPSPGRGGCGTGAWDHPCSLPGTPDVGDLGKMDQSEEKFP